MNSPREIAFVYVGPLESKGRLLKQIATLKNKGLNCWLALGNTNKEEPSSQNFSFPFRSHHVNERSGKLFSFLNQMRFCFRAANWISQSSSDTVVCLGLPGLMAGVLAKRRNQELRLIFDNNELHLEMFGPGIKTAIWRPIHKLGLQSSDVVIHAEPNRLDYFQCNYKGFSAKQATIQNFPFLITGNRSKVNNLPPKTIYLGAIAPDRCTLELVEAFAKHPDSPQLDIVGFGLSRYVKSVEEAITRLNTQQIRLLPSIPHKDIGAFLENYDIGVALYDNTNLNNYFCAPNKIYDYIMSGLCVITNNYPGLKTVVQDNKIGACIPNVSTESISLALEAIIKHDMWKNITPEIKKKYSWEDQEALYLDLIKGTTP